MKKSESKQKFLEPIQVTSGLTDEQADVHGVLGFAYVMNQKLIETRNRGKQGWHDPFDTDGYITDPHFTITWFKNKAKEHIDKGNYIDAANYLMFCYHREKIEKEMEKNERKILTLPHRKQKTK
jgi:hypothetical protein